MSNRQARRARIAAVRNGDPFAKAVRTREGRAKAEDVARHNAAEMEQRNRIREAHERERSRPQPALEPPLGRHLARLQLLAMSMAATEGGRR